MSIKNKTATVLLAIALLAFGILQFIFGTLVLGRPPALVEGLTTFLAYAIGALLLITGCSVFFQWKPSLWLFCIGFFILVWSGAQNLTLTLIRLDYGMLLTNTGKALTLGFGYIFMASQSVTRANNGYSIFYTWISRLAIVSRYATGMFLLISGIQHFIFAEFVKHLIPTWIPGAIYWTYFAGVALIAAGIGLLSGLQLQLASMLAAGMIFFWVLTLHLPRAIANPTQNEWVGVFEAIAFGSILLLLSQRKSGNKKLVL